MLRRYEPTDFPEIESWGKQWDIKFDEAAIPPKGYIVPGVAAYFLFETPSTTCFLENMVSNREVDKEIVHKALDLITEAILKEAKELGFTRAIATTDNSAVVLRAVKSGAKAHANQVLLNKTL